MSNEPQNLTAEWFIDVSRRLIDLREDIAKFTTMSEFLAMDRAQLSTLGFKANEDRLKRCKTELKHLEKTLAKSLEDPTNKRLYLKLKLSGQI